MKKRTFAVVMAVLAALTLTGQADRKAPQGKPLVKQAPVKKQQKTVMHGLKAAKDHGNGPVRAPTTDEDQALTGTAPSTPSTLKSGAVGGATVVLGDDAMADLVVEKQADGKLVTSCGAHGNKPHRHPHAKQPVRPARAVTPALETK